MICAVIADDLTGACDSAVQFAAAGLRTSVVLTGLADADVIAFSTDSRDVEPAEAVRRIRSLAPCVKTVEMLLKKIDSTLRGNTAAEIMAALECFGREVALINPAFPAMGRIVENGFLRVTSDPSFQPIHLPTLLGDERCLCFDAVHQDDLSAKVAEMLASDRRVLWAGSAGMAKALAATLTAGAPGDLPVERPGPVLFCIGSDHPVTVEQQRRLVERRGARHRVLRIERGHLPGEIASIARSALFVCGGDTASLVCRSLGVRSIELRRELAAGIPAGIIRGGPLDGTPIVTKSGGFGAPDDLIHIADYFYA